MITIEITPAIKNEINAEISKAIKSIEKEILISADLRNYEAIERNAKYIKEMKEALNLGVI